ncbi:hypothetical protein BGY98DRAFT_1113126, partial [Russula aff. rugulosa BPL654]
MVTRLSAAKKPRDAYSQGSCRDGFRCIITRTYDYQSPGQSTELEQEVINSDVGTTSTKCVHIFPQSTAMISIDDKDAKVRSTSMPSIWTIMTYFGFEDLPEKLVGNGIHTLENDNTYAIRARLKAILRSCKGNPITLTSEHPDLPLPSRTFLAIHAACCRIADFSGATKYIRKTLDDMEDIGVLAKGGS